MSIELQDQLQRACDAFARTQGKVAVIVQSKSAPDLSAAVNASAPLPAASVIKIAIACTAADEANRHATVLSQQVAASSLDETFYCSILQAFDPSDRLSLKNLIGLMLIVSDNPATTAVLEIIDMDKVNAWLQHNGMADTKISIGFDDASLGAPLRANMTTAADCLALLQHVDKDPTYAFVKRMLANNLRNERIPKRLPDEAMIAHKTGTLNGLVHDIAIIDSPSASYFLVILADELEDEARFVADLSAFSETIYDLMSG